MYRGGIPPGGVPLLLRQGTKEKQKINEKLMTGFKNRCNSSEDCAIIPSVIRSEKNEDKERNDVDINLFYMGDGFRGPKRGNGLSGALYI